MPKGGKGKSSASSATRKKHASKVVKKTAMERDEQGNLLYPELAEALYQPAQRGQKKDKTKGKGKTKLEKKKQFIPPPKPPQPLPDPLDSMGLAHLLPADLVVLLRKASKKDVVTRCRALEGLLVWVQAVVGDRDPNLEPSHVELASDENYDALLLMLPCWVHLFPRLALSPTRRLRSLTMQIQSLLLQPRKQTNVLSQHTSSSSSREELLLSPHYAEQMLGPWAILCHDTDRFIERIGKAMWQDGCTWQQTDHTTADQGVRLSLTDHLGTLLDHIKLILLSPSPSLSLAMTVAHVGSSSFSAPTSGAATPAATAISDRDAKNRDDTNIEEDSSAVDKRLVAGALSVLSYIISTHSQPKPDQDLEPLLSSKRVWSSLSPQNLLSTNQRSQSNETTSSFGYDSSAVRTRAWRLLRTLHLSMPVMLDGCVDTITTVAMSAAWLERDVVVQGAMLDALLPLLKARPEMWNFDLQQNLSSCRRSMPLGSIQVDEEEEEDSGTEAESQSESDSGGNGVSEKAQSSSNQVDRVATASASYLAFLQWLQSACGGSPSLCYPSVLVFISTIPNNLLLWSSREACSNLLTNLYSALYSRALDNDPAGSRAFLSAFCECAAYLASRMFCSSDNAETQNKAALLAQEHFGAVWRELILDTPLITHETTSEDDARARKMRIKSMGGAKVSLELSAHVRRLFALQGSGELCQPFFSTVFHDLTSLAKIETIESGINSGSFDSVELNASVGRITVFLSGLLKLQPTASGDSTQLRDSIKRLIDSLVNNVSCSIHALAASTHQGSAEVRKQVDHLVSMLSMLVRILSSAHQLPSTIALESLANVASSSIPHLTSLKSISISTASSFMAAYLPICPTKESQSMVWSNVLGSVVKLQSVADQVEALSVLVQAVDDIGTMFNQDLKIQEEMATAGANSGLGDLSLELSIQLCNEGGSSSVSRSKLRDVVAALIARPQPFIEPPVAEQMLVILTSSIEHLRHAAINQTSSALKDRNTDQQPAATLLPDLLACLGSWAKSLPSGAAARFLRDSSALSGAITAVFDLAFLTGPSSMADASMSATTMAASELWSHLSLPTNDDLQTEVLYQALQSLQGHLLDVQVSVDVIVSASSTICHPLRQIPQTAVLPSSEQLSAMMIRATKPRPSCALSIFDHLIPQDEPFDNEATDTSLFDAQGLAPYTRCAWTALLLVEKDRTIANKQPYLLPHIVQLALFVEDELLQHESSKHVLGLQASRKILQNMLDRSISAATRLLSAICADFPENWHSAMVSKLQRVEAVDSGQSAIEHTVTVTWLLAQQHADSSHLSRLFCRLLSGIFSFTSLSQTEAEGWLRLGQSLRQKTPMLAQGLILKTKPFLPSSPVYDRLRNDFASNLSGVPPSQASGKGLELLRIAIAAAPDLDSEVAMIPPQRAIFLLQGLQKWLASDEELAEEINTRLAELLISLIPIVQDIDGSHVEFFYDLVESNLEVSSLSDDTSLPGLYHTLRLLETLQDYSLSNSLLREVWKARKSICLDMVRDLYLSLAQSLSDSSEQSAPRDACAELIVDLVREVPSTRFALEQTSESLGKLIIQSTVHEVQVTSYRLLSASIKDRIKEQVVEAALGKSSVAASDSDGEKELNSATIPQVLVDNAAEGLSDKLNSLVEEEHARRRAFGYFLSWIAIFDHFEDTSLQVKAVYVGDLEKRGLVAGSLLPSVFALTGLVNHDRRPFDPSRWVIDEVFLDEIDPSGLPTIQLLATHVYFRALIHVPTLVRNWWIDIKDRQLSLQVASFTSRYCTPLIAQRELTHLREPEALSRLQDEAMSIKILSTNEVIATYTVDEHPMELGVKIPADFPLHGVEIRDIQRVGIQEAQWRAWLLAVQQLITGQNGLIFDALSLFKRNAEVQFQGLDECAICYSIISPMDRSLPTKPCKTCKNKFHAGCLFKWISTSGASTCPLCRSIL